MTEAELKTWLRQRIAELARMDSSDEISHQQSCTIIPLLGNSWIISRAGCSRKAPSPYRTEPSRSISTTNRSRSLALGAGFQELATRMHSGNCSNGVWMPLEWFPTRDSRDGAAEIAARRVRALEV